MSVHVEVLVGNGNAHTTRKMTISRVTNLGREGSPTDDIRNMVSSYAVILGGGRDQKRATIVHRYGDDMFILIAKAAEAIRAKYPGEHL